jgi:hypothetical protein
MNNYFGENDTNYTSFVNLKMKDFFGKKKHGAIFGQNIISGSRISGLGNNLENLNNVKVINATNSENSLMGLGLGLALEGVPAIFLMKQHDFALLGLDQLTNTVNLISSQGFKESFIVVMVVVDSGYEGPQASLNNIDDFASLTRSPVYLLNSKESIENAFASAEIPGLHMMVLSQKAMKRPLVNNVGGIQKIGSLIKYQRSGGGYRTEKLLIYTGINLELLNRVIEISFKDKIFFDLMIVSDISPKNDVDYNENFTGYRKIAIIHDSKSIFTASHYMATKIDITDRSIQIFTRQASNIWTTTNSDLPEYTAEDVVSFLAK